jgi:hypothetical protein
MSNTKFNEIVMEYNRYEKYIKKQPSVKLVSISTRNQQKEIDLFFNKYYKKYNKKFKKYNKNTIKNTISNIQQK